MCEHKDWLRIRGSAPSDREWERDLNFNVCTHCHSPTGCSVGWSLSGPSVRRNIRSIKNMGNVVMWELDIKNTLKTTASLSRKINNSTILSSSEKFLWQYHEWFKSHFLLKTFYIFLKTITLNQYIQIVIIIEVKIFLQNFSYTNKFSTQENEKINFIASKLLLKMPINTWCKKRK